MGLLEKSEIFRLSEILRRRSEILITYLYKTHFFIYTSLSGLCTPYTSFSKVTLFSLPEVFCGPQVCQKCTGGRARWGAHDAPPDSTPLSTHNSTCIRKYLVGNLVTIEHPQYPSAIRLCSLSLSNKTTPHRYGQIW